MARLLLLRWPMPASRERLPSARFSALNKTLDLRPLFVASDGSAVDADLFEDLLAEMVTTFVRTTSEQVDSQIDRWLERVGLAIDLDRINMADYEYPTGILRTAHSWAREGLARVPMGIDSRAIIPWATDRLLAGETIVFSTRDELPPAANGDLTSAVTKEAKSSVLMPLKVGSVVVGAIGFGSFRHERQWSSQLLRQLDRVAEVFANALERKRDIGQVRRLRNELYQVSARSMMGELTASLAHELNQPLGAILNNAEAAARLLDGERPDIAEVKSAIDDIIRDDRRASEIIGHVRALLRRGESKPSQLDVAEVMLDVKRILKQDAAMRDISLGIESSDPLPTISGDRTQLTQALTNLILNAFDAVAENGDIPRSVSVTARARESGSVSIEVRDSGKGIDPRAIPDLFRPFFTTKPNGMGMGLAIVRSIIESHGGDIQVRSNADRGTTFEIILPPAPRPPANGDTAKPHTP